MFSPLTISLKNVTRNINATTAGLVAAALCWLGSLAHAGSLNIDFEAPTYTGSPGLGTGIGGSVGGYNGQGGWDLANTDNPPLPGISTGGTASGLNPIVGSQSLYMQGDQGTIKVLQNAFGLGWADGSTESVLAQFSSNTASDVFIVDFTYASSSAGAFPIGRVAFTNGIVEALSGPSYAPTSLGAAAAGDVYQVIGTLNFTMDTFDVSVKDLTTNVTLSGSGFAFNGGPDNLTSISAADYDQNASIGLISVGGGPGSVMWDNVSFNTPSVPEPSSVVLLVFGAVGLAIASRRRRK